MSMETLNVIQFIELLIGFLGFTVGLPALVFYKKVKHFQASVRFLIYFVIGNFYIINLVQVLELVYVSYRITLILFTILPVIIAVIKIYKIPVWSYIKKIESELYHYILRELGFRSFLRHRLKEMCKAFKFLLRQAVRLLKELWLDLPFLCILIYLIWKICGDGILNNWGYGASDVPVHNYWINGLVENKLYIAGIYPMGMHCMLYYLATVLNIPVYVTLRLFWLVQYSMIVFMLLLFLKGFCKTRFLPHLGVIGFVGLKYFVGISYSRFGATLPQEFGMLYILPAIYFLLEYFKTRKAELENGENKIRCCSSWNLLGFAMSFSLTLSSHFYDSIIAGIICVGIAIGYSAWIWRKGYLFRIIVSGVLGVLMALLPMAVAFLTGKELQGSMYWAMSIIGLKDYTVLVFRIICLIVVAITLAGILFLVRGMKRKTISFTENRPIRTDAKAILILFGVLGLLLLAATLFVGWNYKETILWGYEQHVIGLPNTKWLLYGAVIVLIIGIIQRYLGQKMNGAIILSMFIAELLLGLILVSGNIGWPMLMEPYRVCIYAAYLIPVIVIVTVDGIVNLLCFNHFLRFQRVIAFGIATVLLGYSTKLDLLKAPFGGGQLEMNEAIFCTTNILKDNKGKNNMWTIISANDELRMVELYGRHTETITFLQEMEFWNQNKEVVIPTERVYFYIEKKPLNYAGGYNGEIPEISEKQAKKALSQGAEMDAYSGKNRSVTMSRMYYWAQEFQKLYPNEFKVYFEDENFVCYYIEQNVYRLYNFAIDYGYN
ncbi:hypothetical protein [Blautia stercoris]|nr:hypothetical protein [Blautia stercoris]